MSSYNRDADIVEALRNDPNFNFPKKNSTKTLSGGTCPDCGQKTIWVKLAKPGRVWCNRENNCGYTETTAEIYPHLFEDYTENHPATDADPNATARAYLTDRGFNEGKIAGMYQQGYRPIGGGVLAPTVRINLWDGHHWERIIDKKHVARAKRKNHFSYEITYKDKCWKRDGFKLKEGDICVITEGIFNAWCFLDLGYEAVASFSSNNLPRELIKEYQGKGIIWLLAYDNDKAGITHAAKYAKELAKMGELFQVILTQTRDRDWNDDFRLERINEEYLENARWRGCVATAETVRDKAFWLWAKYPQTRIHTEFNNAIYSYEIDGDARGQVCDALDKTELSHLWIDPMADITSAQKAFSPLIKGGRISNCLPRFLYIERDPLTLEQDYFFQISFMNGNPTRLIAMDGSCLESASSLNKALLNRTSGGTFDGKAEDIKRMKEQWFDKRTTEITRLRFIGYDKESAAWVFPEFGFHGGRFYPLNDQGFIEAGKNRVKSKVSSTQVKMISAQHLDESWIGTFESAFGPNGMILMGWWFGTLFAEHIRGRYADWPFAELTGEPGTGKTTLICFLWRCCGRTDGYEGFDPNKTTLVGRSRNFERYSGLPSVLIEGDRSRDDNRKAHKQSYDFNELKDFFNGGVIRSTGAYTGGTETIEPNFRGGVLVAQNETVQCDDAVMERIVRCHSTKAHHTKDSKRIANLVANMKADQLAGWMHKALTSESAFLEMFDKKFTEILAVFQSRREPVRVRIIENHAKIAASIWCLQILFPAYMTSGKCQTLQELCWEMAVERERVIKADTDLVALFWEYFDELNFVDFEDPGTRTTYTGERLNHSKDRDLIAVNLVECERVFDQNRVGKFNRHDWNDLKKQLPNCQSHPFVARKSISSQVDGKTKSCWVFKRQK